MNALELKNAIFDANHPERQIQAAYQMRYVQNDNEVVMILFRACYEAINPKLQQEAVRSLGVLKPQRALEAFTKSTFSPDADKRMRAYYHLGTLGDPKTMPTLCRGFGDPEEKVRKAAVISAGRLGQDLTVINFLQQLLNGFEPEPVKQAARISIHTIRKRLSGKEVPIQERSFNSAPGKKTANKSFTAGAYTPKGF